MTIVREFRQEAKLRGKTKRWRVMVEGPDVSVQDGFVGGKLKMWTTTTMEPVNIGKANQKTAEECAVDEMERRILLKTRQGYREVNSDTGKFLQEAAAAVTSLTSFKELPQNLRFYKPQNTVNVYMQKMMDERTAYWLRKRDGNMFIYAVDEDGQHQMYSSTLSTHQKDEPDKLIIERFPHIKESMLEANPPRGTVFLGEVCCGGGVQSDEDGFDVDDLDYVGGVLRGLTEYSVKLQEEKGKLSYCIWDIAFWDGRDLLNEVPAARRFATAEKFCHLQKTTGFLTYPERARWSEKGNCIYVHSHTGDFTITETWDRTVEQVLLDLAKDHNWEGWVVVDPDAIFGEKGYNFRGKPERPKQSVKLKPEYEADFVVMWNPDAGIGNRGKGKKSKGVGSVACYLWDPEAEEYVYISLCGGGLTDEDVVTFADPDLYPMVWKIAFTSVTKPSEESPLGSLQFPKFISVREDKTPEECLVDQLPAPRGINGEVSEE